MKKHTYHIVWLLFLLIMAGAAAYAQRESAKADMKITTATRIEVIDGAIRLLNESYVFPDVARKMEESIRARAKAHAYDTVTSAAVLCEMLTSDLRAVSSDRHLSVMFDTATHVVGQAEGEESAEDREQRRAWGMQQNFGFQKLERLPGNVGYLELTGFHDPEFAAETAISAMNFLSNTDALIIDLRRNGGGSPAAVALISSYFFGAEPVHLNSLYWRPTDSTQQWWTLPYVPGKRYLRKPIYLLTSSYTFSAAEEFTYNLKNLKRATIIGETTGGGAHPGGVQQINEHFAVWVPSGRAINPITGTNWEGTGVAPDMNVPPDQALKTAHLTALKSVVGKKEEPLAAQYRKLMGELEKDLDGMRKGVAGEGTVTPPGK